MAEHLFPVVAPGAVRGGIAALLLALAPAPALAADGDAAAVLDCAARNAPERTFEQTLDFKVVRDGGERVIESKVRGLREKDGLKLNFRIDAPSDLAGTAVLIREKAGQDDMHLYLPGLQRTRRISGQMAATKLFGTDFSYLDIKQIFGAFLDGPRRYEKPDTVSGRAGDRVRVTPSPEESAPFASLSTVIDKKTCVPLLVDFHDADGALVKQLLGDPASLVTVGGRNLLSRYVLKDLQLDSRTEITFGKVEFDDKLSRNLFDPRLFQDAR